jgi:hypothetical protein
MGRVGEKGVGDEILTSELSKPHHVSIVEELPT